MDRDAHKDRFTVIATLKGRQTPLIIWYKPIDEFKEAYMVLDENNNFISYLTKESGEWQAVKTVAQLSSEECQDIGGQIEKLQGV